MDRAVLEASHDHQGLMSSDSIDFWGSTCTGKTSILTQFVANTVLPAVWNIQIDGEEFPVHINGGGGSVLFLDLDLQFSVNRLYNMTLNRVTEAIEQCPEDVKCKLIGRDEEIHNLVLTSLSRCHTFRLTSIGDLSNTINGLSRWLHQHADENVKYVMIDSISSALWSKRDNANTQHPLYGTLAEELHNQITRTLQHLQAQWNFVVCTTTRKLFASPREEVPPSWAKFWNYRVELRRLDSDYTDQLADYEFRVVQSSRSSLPLGTFHPDRNFRYAIRDNGILVYNSAP
ncbi:DNA repair protein xrcc2 [Umbelopsis nana]